jgi:subtilisin
MRLRGISRDWAWGGSTGAGVRVGIVDSGLETDHPRLAGRVVQSVAVELVDGDPRIVPDDGTDLYGHATACGGIILGLAPEVELISIRVLGADLRGKGAAFAAGLEWAIDQGIDVLNLSLSSKSEALFPVFHDLVDRAYFKGTAIVSAANNVPAASYPSLFSSVFSVAAHGEPDPWRLYYNPAPPVEFGAWGVDVPIAWKDGGSTVATGNSFAAPHVAAMVALILAKHPGLTPFEVKAILAAVADNPRRGSPVPSGLAEPHEAPA